MAVMTCNMVDYDWDQIENVSYNQESAHTLRLSSFKTSCPPRHAHLRTLLSPIFLISSARCSSD